MAADAAGYLALRQNDHAQATLWLDEALNVHRAIGDKQATALTLRHMGVVAHQLREYDRGIACLEGSLAWPGSWATEGTPISRCATSAICGSSVANTSSPRKRFSSA